MIKRTLSAVALATVLAAPAFAQQSTAPDTTGKTDIKTDMVKHGSMTNSAAQPGFVQQQDVAEWRGSKLIGTNVYGPDNASIGEIDDLVIGNDGNIQAVVVGVGGFLGVGQKDVAVPFTALHIARKADSASIDKITVSYSKDELKNAPKFAFYAASQAQTTGSGVTERLKTMPPVGSGPLNPPKAK